MNGNRFKYFSILMWYLLNANTTFAYTHADTLRGSDGSGRNWWDVKKYNLFVEFDTAEKRIKGSCRITFDILKADGDSMQIDLQDSMSIESISLETSDRSASSKLIQKDSLNDFKKDGNVWWVNTSGRKWDEKYRYTLAITYRGKPRLAGNPPWDGGFIWGKDSLGKQWISVACQGLGASAWWPCKDAQWDEPDEGVTLSFIYPKGLTLVSNGKLIDSFSTGNITQTIWYVKNPINSYDITFYMGDYIHWRDTMMGEKGKLELNFYALSYNEAKARAQFQIVKPMLRCFEYWMGSYPFYEDGYKLVEAPYLGMEHQSAVAYGNEYKMGYRGMDRSGTGVGLLFDFIIVHESGHEWFGNNITAYDIADNWIHEGFTTYTETLFTECLFGKEKAFEYLRGQRQNIRNDRPIIGDYGVNTEGSSDMYDKGSSTVHMIRMMMNNDEKFRRLLRDINSKYYHGTVSTKELEQFISDTTHLQLGAFFDQYLRSTQIPELEYYIKDGQLYYKFNNIVNGFSLPLQVTDGEITANIQPTANWQHIRWKGGYNVAFPKDYYLRIKS